MSEYNRYILANICAMVHIGWILVQYCTNMAVLLGKVSATSYIQSGYVVITRLWIVRFCWNLVWWYIDVRFVIKAENEWGTGFLKWQCSANCHSYPNHVLHRLFPRVSSISQTDSLRPRAHDGVLSEHSIQRTRPFFITVLCTFALFMFNCALPTGQNKQIIIMTVKILAAYTQFRKWLTTTCSRISTLLSRATISPLQYVLVS